MTKEPALRARKALDDSGLAASVTVHGPVSSLEEAAATRGVGPDQVLKSIVVRRGDGDLLFVLVPGGRSIAWPRLRALLGVSRLSLASRDEAEQSTGYVPGTITPFGSLTAWPVIADERVAGPVSIGGGASGVAFTIEAAALISFLGATVADVTDVG